MGQHFTEHRPTISNYKNSSEFSPSNPQILEDPTLNFMNDELFLKLKTLDSSKLHSNFKYEIPYYTKTTMIDSMLEKFFVFKSRYYSPKFLDKIIMIIDMKKVKNEDLHSKFFKELVEYLNIFFSWNMEYVVFLEHFKIVRDLFVSVSLELRKIFYELFLKKSHLVFNKRIFFLMMYMLNEMKLFRSSFIQIVNMLLDYSVCKGKFFFSLSTF